MGFGRFRKLFRRGPTRQGLYLRLTRGLNIERDYQAWIETWERYGPADAPLESQLPLLTVLVGTPSEADREYWARTASELAMVPPIRAEAPMSGRQACQILERAPGAHAGEYVAILHANDRLSRIAPARLAAAMKTGAALVYGDEDQADGEGRRFAPWFKPDFGEDLFICQNGFGRAVFFRRSALQPMSQADECVDLDSFLYGLALDIVASGGEPLHCPGILVHVAGNPVQTPKARVFYLSGSTRRPAVESFIGTRRSLAGAAVERSGAYDFLRLRHPLPDPLPLVSIIIPTRDRTDLLELCVNSLDRETSYPNKEIIIIDNDSAEAATAAYFAHLSTRPDVRIVSAPGPFNYPRLINLGVSQGRGDLVMTLNNDIEAFEPEWLHEMVSQVSRPGVGLVGCLLLYPNRNVQHAGVIVGLSGVAGHIFGNAAPDDPGYAGRILVTQDLSAVTGACHVMRRSLFDELGGLDERNLAIAYNDIDFCLRVREAGLRVIYTPHARLLHRHSASRGSDVRQERLAGFTWEREYMRTRWAHVIFDDPFFNPNLSLSGKRGRLATAPRRRALGRI